MEAKESPLRTTVLKLTAAKRPRQPQWRRPGLAAAQQASAKRTPNPRPLNDPMDSFCQETFISSKGSLSHLRVRRDKLWADLGAIR